MLGMNEREEYIVNNLRLVLIENWKDGKEQTVKQLTNQVNQGLRKNGYPYRATGRLIGGYLKKFLGINTEKRGNLNHTYPIYTPENYRRLLGTVIIQI